MCLLKMKLFLGSNLWMADVKLANILEVSSFQWHWTPGNELVIDEDVCSLKGSSMLKQYLPAKPHKWGFESGRCTILPDTSSTLTCIKVSKKLVITTMILRLAEKVAQYLLHM